MLNQAAAICVTCARAGRTFTGRYGEFLRAPGTLFTLVSLLFLVAAAIRYPAELISSSDGQDDTYLYLVAALIGSVYIWWSAVQALRKGDFTADIPVSIATAAALVIGAYSAAAVVAVLLLLGGMLESFVASRAGMALDALAALLPNWVTVRHGSQESRVRLEVVVEGDILLIRSGERIAVDGEVRSGTALVDQAAVTGESMPVDKVLGDPVFAGTLIELGTLTVRADRVGEETTLGQVRRMVMEAQEKKAPIERVLNRYAKLYTPAALIMGGLLWWWSGDVVRAITMLIVFCPCVMVLATPTALVASIGNAALRGSLVKKGATVEAMAKVDTVLFDKTGTLTLGQPRLVNTISLDGPSSQELLRLAASAEKFSEHPLGRAIVRAADSAGVETMDPELFKPLPGSGIQAVSGGRDLLLGRRNLLAEYGIGIPTSVEVQAKEIEASGHTVIWLAYEAKVAGLLVLEDQMRSEAEETIRRLHAAGIRTGLVTGDNEGTARRVAASLGITEVYADVLPQGKEDLVRRLKLEGRCVAFVGDGINDGPALATADVGIAMGVAGTDVAIETAEVALLSDDLSKLPHLLSVSRQAMRAIRQNLAFSLAVLFFAIGLTIPGILTPVTGALIHELSSIPVIANSARLIGLRTS